MKLIMCLSPPKNTIWLLKRLAECPSRAQGFFLILFFRACFTPPSSDCFFLGGLIEEMEFFRDSNVGEGFRNF